MTAPITVVIPLYNGEKYIKETIESILEQSIRPKEIIVVIDGSEDKSEEILLRYPIRIIKQENGGISKARNKGINESVSDWIAFCDQDDVWFTDKIEKQYEVLKKNPNIDIIFSDVLFLRGCKEEKSTFQVNQLISSSSISEIMANVYIMDSDKLIDIIKSGNIITPSTMLVRKSILESNLFDTSMIRIEDRELFLRIFPSANIAMMANPLVYYRIHDDNHSSDKYKMALGKALFTEKVINNNNLYSESVCNYTLSHAADVFYNAGSYALQSHDYSNASKFLGMSFRRKLRIKSLLKLMYALIKKLLNNKNR